MDIDDKDVKIKMSICPECENIIRVGIEHLMGKNSKKEFADEVMYYNLNVKSISLDEYRTSNIGMYCKEGCNHMKQKS